MHERGIGRRTGIEHILIAALIIGLALGLGFALNELDAALKAGRESKSGAYIEVIGGRMDMPKGLAFAQTRLKELYGQAV